MTGTVRVVTAPAAYPVTLAQAKEWCRVDDDDASQDATLVMLIMGITNHAENVLTGRAYVERTLELSFDYASYCMPTSYQYASINNNRWPGYQFWPGIQLPFPPLLAVESITYTDVHGDPQTMDPVTYEYDQAEEPGLVRPLFGSYWPRVGRVFNAFRIRYRAGYRPIGSPTDLTDNSYLPGQLRVWMNARICTLYDNRAQWAEGRLLQIPRDFVDALLDDLVVGTRLF